ncbi:MAG: two-component sensor histidine kinase [Geobacteraceae bacterium GWC2_55_20]|nr:MAG: two-component sensor histidine kinase [Geobacteraceae bacterium GWC2_55_20]OGU23659.1 MAG: two-component sensor histidine kinase [Geobacteraceae bacterium GWF2_54_21]HBA71831.1 two-component sensor histidine kinase [Geobacter sp.]HCE69109.1 two-component sensor histidine kinase [Geobacter sp.]
MTTPADTHSSGAISNELFRQMAYNEKMAELGRISAGVVHELNAPLSVITSAAQMILREDEVPEFVREMVGRINSEAHRLSQLTRGLLNFSSHDDIGGESDVNLTIDFVLEFIKFEAAQRGVTVSRRLDHSLPMIGINNNSLKQILLNIIMNALQAMETDGGTLLVETSAPPDNRVCIKITDSGPGMTETTLSKIFEPYFTTKKPGEGTGLGLFVTRTLVEQDGGSIVVASRADVGTCFTILFDAAA